MTNPEKLKLLAVFMKRNKKAREVKAKKEGFASAADYEAFLRDDTASQRMDFVRAAMNTHGGSATKAKFEKEFAGASVFWG